MNVKNRLVLGALFGFVVGIVFIFVQPLFGMSPLTDRHAAAYVKLGSLQPVTAVIVAWSAHLIVSIGYGVATAIALLISRSIWLFALQVILLGWLTTVIAGPANALIVRLVTTQGMPSLESLPPLNFDFDAKLALHIIFFLSIALPLSLTRRIRKR